MKLSSTYLSLPSPFFSEVLPTHPPDPKLILFNEPLAEELGLPLKSKNNLELAALFSGSELFEGSTPFAQGYAGHQFGHFTLLGDGRAHVLGEWVTEEGERFDIQLKGSGQTPYSRRGDGRAALGPMLREYLISEAMAALGIPTTRSLAVVTTGEPVFRETVLPGAVLTRIAKSHIRVGTFEFAALQNDRELVKALADYTIARHFPELEDSPQKYLAFFNEVIERQAALIARWLSVGFIHGVMNTDNMAISGETIDYGPCAFMDEYSPACVFSSIDSGGRYAYGNQPAIGKWNLSRFGETLLPLLHEDENKALELALSAVNSFSSRFIEAWRSEIGKKLGLLSLLPEDQKLFEELFFLMEKEHLDFTNTFINLHTPEESLSPELKSWRGKLKKRWELKGIPEEDARAIMASANPALIPRNHTVHEALRVSEYDLTPFHKLLEALRTPFQHELLPKDSPFRAPPREEERVRATFCGT